MMRRHRILLLLSGLWFCAGCVLLGRLQADDVVTLFHAVSQKTSWAEAQSYCRTKFTDLVSIPDVATNAEVLQAAGRGKFWIGLFNTSWRWSLGNQDVSTSSWYTKWGPAEPSPGYCVTVSVFGSWFVRDCTVQHKFFCYNAASKSHVLVDTMMTWANAQTYCRSKYTDLSSVTSAEENVHVSGLQLLAPGVMVTENGTNTTADLFSSPEAWIGLHRFFWGWSDHNSSPYRRWGRKQPNENVNCVIMDSSSGDWYRQQCNENFSFLCYKTGKASALRTVKVRLNGGSADLNNQDLQDSILQQLTQKLQDGGISEEVKLSWRKQPDGNVFHREEERAPPCGRQKKEHACVTL